MKLLLILPAPNLEGIGYYLTFAAEKEAREGNESVPFFHFHIPRSTGKG